MNEAGGARVVARNRKAFHKYHVLEEIEAGVVLRGSEVKSLRRGKASFTDSYGRIESGEAWLHNLHISPYDKAAAGAHDPVRPRKLLLKRREIARLASKTLERGLTLVPLDIHFRRGYAKVTLGLARGKTQRDRREDLKRKAMQREADRAMSEVRRRM